MSDNLKKLFSDHFDEQVTSFEPLAAHGSNRQYSRIKSDKRSVIGVTNADRLENEAFIDFSRHFRKKGLAVPEIYAEDLDDNVYLEEDLGDETLFDYLQTVRGGKKEFPDELLAVYEQVVDRLPEFQIKGGEGLDYSKSYPHHSFDRQSMMWDLNYFKYYFLKLAHVQFNEQKLEADFKTFIDFLLSADSDHFLYRDFQSRNVMLKDGKPWFIDYQGGRRGALQYDIASLLFDAKADLPFEVREKLLDRYLSAAEKLIPIDREAFTKHYYAFVYIRIMQAMGAYGYRGFYERKTHFLQSIPYAIQNLEYLVQKVDLPVELPAMMDVFQQLIRSSALREFGKANLRLKVRIVSFSYKHGVPVDNRGHGGGFVFDCRFLPNPGRDIVYKQLTGNDPEVIEWFADKPDMDRWLKRVYNMVDAAVNSYQEQNFTDLMVSFGCTGGQHRSVHSANRLAAHLQETHDVDVVLSHRELDEA
ncbi:MAG: phosphotransferase [Candidatus Marinimicrobia bacterium]|nr:phosphotransferase [Candidatus Neomarinimicrobiota bacterium]MCF7904517.1 phosphotransferase [Candidatus Neomarinimicrobiota bacterium]